MNKTLYYIIWVIVITLFVLGFFNLTETRFGYDSPLMSIAIQIGLFNFLYKKIDDKK